MCFPQYWRVSRINDSDGIYLQNNCICDCQSSSLVDETVNNYWLYEVNRYKQYEIKHSFVKLWDLVHMTQIPPIIEFSSTLIWNFPCRSFQTSNLNRSRFLSYAFNCLFESITWIENWITNTVYDGEDTIHIEHMVSRKMNTSSFVFCAKAIVTEIITHDYAHNANLWANLKLPQTIHTIAAYLMFAWLSHHLVQAA